MTTTDQTEFGLRETLGKIEFGQPNVYLLVSKPSPGVHVVRHEVFVRSGLGFEGDHERVAYYRGEIVPGRQVSAVSSEFCFAAGIDPVTIGDNLVTAGVDLRMLEPGVRIRLGDSVVLERSTADHRPCLLFAERAGRVAYNVAKAANWRGALFDVVRSGTVRVGDALVVGC